MSASDVSFNALPKDMIKNVPANYKIPSAKIGRLARNSKITTRGFGVALMVNAFGQVDRLSKEIGIALVDIDAKNSKVATYYKNYGFVELLGHPNSLVIATSTLSNILAMVLEDAIV